jgi:outer membrane immunogenic protein
MKGSTDCVVIATCTPKNDWLATARVRLGYAGWNNWLPFGGLAMGDVKASSVLGDASKTKIGWVAGLGIEYAMLGIGA